MTEFHSYAPASGHGLKHNPFKALIAPRPIGWISTLSKSGVSNLAPYSYFNALSETPPILAFSSTGKKNTVSNIMETGEFVHNVVDVRIAEVMNATSANFTAQESEFDTVPVAAMPSDEVAPFRVAAAAASMECKLIEVKQLRDMHGIETDSYLVLGQVVRVHINTNFIRDGIVDEAALMLMGRLGYINYSKVDHTIEMPRPVLKR